LVTRLARCDEARRQERAGLGLGISTNRRIREAQGGKLTRHSVRRSGVVTRIMFPAA
jgi:signal transduction histidine kinase